MNDMFPHLLFSNQLELCIIMTLKGLNHTYFIKQKSGFRENITSEKTNETNKPESQTEGKQNRF